MQRAGKIVLWAFHGSAYYSLAEGRSGRSTGRPQFYSKNQVRVVGIADRPLFGKPDASGARLTLHRVRDWGEPDAA
jgi:hypothetical protein